MKAIGQMIYGGPEVLHFLTVPKPEPKPDDIIVRVKAAGVNPVDAKMRRGGGPPGTPVPNPPLIVGWDAAGLVEEVGPKAGRFKPGDEVYFAGDNTRPGSYAEFVAVDGRIVGRKPATLNFEAAAAVPLTALTAWEALFENMKIPHEGAEPGKTILVVGGAGGVGSIAIQMARRVGKLHVIATASRPASTAFCRQMGAHAVIDHTQPLAAQLKALGLDGVDYILNCAELTNFAQLVSILKPLGTICSILAGEPARALDVSGLMPIRGTLTFELMFTRPRYKVEPERQGQILDRVAALLDRQVLASTMTQVMAWSEVQKAHQAIETVHTIGKIVLRVR